MLPFITYPHIYTTSIHHYEEVWYVFYEYTNSFGQRIAVMGKRGGASGDCKSVVITESPYIVSPPPQYTFTTIYSLD